MIDKDILNENWKQLRANAKAWWDLLTDDDLNQIGGRHEILVFKLQEKYGYTYKEAENAIHDFIAAVAPESQMSR